MEVVKKTKQVEYEMYRTTDGIEFASKEDALLHEDKKNGKKKDCPECKGTGRVNKRCVKEWRNTGMMPGDGEYFNVEKSDECSTCGGKGILTLKWS